MSLTDRLNGASDQRQAMTAMAEYAVHCLEQIRDGIGSSNPRIQAVRASYVVNADGTGAGQSEPAKVKPGIEAKLVAVVGTAPAAGGKIALYLNQVAPSSLLWATDVDGTVFAEATPEGLVVPDNADLIVAAVGVQAGAQVVVNVAARYMVKPPEPHHATYSET